MTIGGSLRLSHELGVIKIHGQQNGYKRLKMRNREHLFGAYLSSCSSRQDAWSLCFSDRRYKPDYHFQCGHRAIICQSNLGDVIPILKRASLALTRSHVALLETPVALHFVPAVGIIVFSIWVLGPLMRWIRAQFFHRSDSNWKKSRTYYILTSYLRPLLLWTGATLICSSLDPIVLPSETRQVVKQRLLNFFRSLSTVLAFAYCLSSFIQQAQKFFMEKTDLNDARNMGFLVAGRAVYSGVWVAAIVLFLELMGFPTQKWITAGGLGTVILTLAGREIFTNFLASIILHATRPFVVNEWIQTRIEGSEVSGTVERVGWWSPSIIRGDDREAIHIPNNKFTVNIVRNLSQKTHWRIKTHLAISHLDVSKINNIVADMRKVLAKNPQVEQQRLHRRVFLENVDPENQALLILVSCFVKTSRFEEYLCVKEAILLDLLRVISHHRARLATPIRTVQKYYGDADLENIPFADNIYTRARGINRPYLLVEPSPKMNGDERTKPRPVARASEDQASNETSTSETKTIPVSEATQTNNEKQPQKKASSGEAASEDQASNGTPTSETKTIPVLEATQTNTETQPRKKASSGEVPAKSTKIKPEAPYPSTVQSKSQLEGLNTVETKPKAGSEKPPSSEPVGEQESSVPPPPKTMARSAFGDNIVLGVALEGSKRTLPIEEGMGSPPASVEVNELAAARNGNGSPSSMKDKKDEQNTSYPRITAADQRDQER